MLVVTKCHPALNFVSPPPPRRRRHKTNKRPVEINWGLLFCFSFRGAFELELGRKLQSGLKRQARAPPVQFQFSTRALLASGHLLAVASLWRVCLLATDERVCLSRSRSHCSPGGGQQLGPTARPRHSSSERDRTVTSGEIREGCPPARPIFNIKINWRRSSKWSPSPSPSPSLSPNSWLAGWLAGHLESECVKEVSSRSQECTRLVRSSQAFSSSSTLAWNLAAK